MEEVEVEAEEEVEVGMGWIVDISISRFVW